MSRMGCEEAAARKLASRDVSVEELRRFLLQKDYEKSEVEAVIRQFKEDGYLDDRRYCLAYFSYAFSKNKGKNRVFAELRKRGVDSEIMEFAYEDFCAEQEVDEWAMARDEAEKILRLADLTFDDPIPEKIRGRVARKLQSFGYSTTIIYGILDEMKREVDW